VQQEVSMRELNHDGLLWVVREVETENVPGARAGRCLLFESDAVVRRVWEYPADWAERSDAFLRGLVERRQSPRGGRMLHLANAEDSQSTSEVLGGPMAVTSRTRLLLSEVTRVERARNVEGLERERLLERCGERRAEMRAAVRAYAEALRRDGIPPERALVFIKSAMQAGIAAAVMPEASAEAVLHEGVEWCIAAYYAA
jgi:hypothetical protein